MLEKSQLFRIDATEEDGENEEEEEEEEEAVSAEVTADAAKCPNTGGWMRYPRRGCNNSSPLAFISVEEKEIGDMLISEEKEDEGIKEDILSTPWAASSSLGGV